MELIDASVHTTTSATFKTKEAIIVPLGDIHFGVPECNVDKLKKLISWGSKQKNVYFIGLGDYLDYSPTSVRKSIAVYKLDSKFNSTFDIIDEFVEKKQNELHKLLKPLQGKFIGLVQGNHHHEFQDGTTTDTRLAEFLGCDYLGTSGIICVKLKAFTGGNKNPQCHIFVHHGKSSVAPMNVLTKLSAGIIADIYITGHNHRKEAKVLPRISAEFCKTIAKLVEKNYYLLSIGGYLQGWMNGSTRRGIPQGGYVEAAMYPPLALGTGYIFLRGVLSGGYSRIDINVMI